MSFFYQSGEGMNLLARAAAVKAPMLINGTIDSAFPISGLYDGRPSVHAKYSNVAAYHIVDFDLNLLLGGDGEVEDLSSWEQSPAGALGRYAGNAYSGTYSLSLSRTEGTPGTYYAQAAKNLYVRAGEKLRLYLAGLKTASTTLGYILLQNMETGKFLTSAGAWSAAETNVAEYTSDVWADSKVTFQMPDAETGGGLWQRLRVFLVGKVVSGTTISCLFEIKLVPGWDTLVVLGHTFTPAVPLAFHYQALSGNDPEDAWVSGTYVADWLKTPHDLQWPIPVNEWDQQAVWNKAQTTRYERWVRFYLTWATYNPSCAVGELILVQAETLPTTYVDMLVSLNQEGTGQLIQESGAGDPWVYNRNPMTRRRLTLRYFTASDPVTGDDPAERAARRLLLERPAAGRWPTLVIPYNFDRRLVIYGRARESLTTEYDKSENKRRLEVEVTEYPIPALHHTLGTP